MRASPARSLPTALSAAGVRRGFGGYRRRMTDAATSPAGVLGDRYVLASLVGRGGMADVHRAHDRVLAREVAVKVLRDTSPDPSARARFIDEARTLARLNHPGLVTLLDAGTSGDRPYLVMELVEHSTLADLCAGTPLEPDRVAALGAQLADALAYVHEHGVVHRDVKPGNVMLTADNRCLLSDFGIAKLLGDATAGHTASGFTMGTAAYLAPEQVQGVAVTPATDVYALGLVLLEALTGRRAYVGAPTEAALARLSSAPDIPSEVDGAWTSLLVRMTALEPATRPMAAEVAAELSRLAGAVSPADATAVLRATTRPLTQHATTGTGKQAGESAGSGRPWAAVQWARWRVLGRAQQLATAGLAVLGVAVLALLLSSLSTEPDPTSDVPAGVPPGISENLQDLHDAVNG